MNLSQNIARAVADQFEGVEFSKALHVVDMAIRRNRKPMTPRQKEIYETFCSLKESMGYAPTLQELSKAVGSSRTTVFEIINVLVRKGWLRRTDSWTRRNLDTVEG